MVFEGAPLHQELTGGGFAQASEMEMLQEEKALMEQIELHNVRFYGVHPSNAVPVSGMLPWDKSKMIEKIDRGIEAYGADPLAGIFRRVSL